MSDPAKRVMWPSQSLDDAVLDRIKRKSEAMSAASLADAGGERSALAGVLWCLEFASITITRSNGGYDITVWPLGEGTGFVRVTHHDSATVHCYSWSEVYAILSEPNPPLWAMEIRDVLRARSSGGKWT